MTEQTPIRLDWSVTKPSDPPHLQWAEAAKLALAECHPDHAAWLCLNYLETVETGGPRHDVFGTLYQDARWWADLAPPHELVAYVSAGLERLPNRRLALPARKALFKRLWRSFPDTDRAAFLAHVKGGR